jgi:hypothetical protein
LQKKPSGDSAVKLLLVIPLASGRSITTRNYDATSLPVVLIFLSCSYRNKKHHSAFDRLVGGGYAFIELTVLTDFCFDKGIIVEVLGPPSNWGPHDLLIFMTIFPVKGTCVESRLYR